jgi:hypothetical protein
VNNKELESFLKKFSPKAYDLAYSLVPDDLHSDELTGFVILAFNRLTEAALPQEIKHFKSKR